MYFGGAEHYDSSTWITATYKEAQTECLPLASVCSSPEYLFEYLEVNQWMKVLTFPPFQANKNNFLKIKTYCKTRVIKRGPCCGTTS